MATLVCRCVCRSSSNEEGGGRPIGSASMRGATLLLSRCKHRMTSGDSARNSVCENGVIRNPNASFVTGCESMTIGCVWRCSVTNSHSGVATTEQCETLHASYDNCLKDQVNARSRLGSVPVVEAMCSG